MTSGSGSNGWIHVKPRRWFEQGWAAGRMVINQGWRLEESASLEWQELVFIVPLPQDDTGQA